MKLRLSNDQFRVEISQHKELPRTAQSKRKTSTEGRRIDAGGSVSLQRRKEVLVGESRQSGCLNTLLHKQTEYKQFADKCYNYLSRKKLSADDSEGGANFCTMLQNIKRTIKENDRRERETRGGHNQGRQNELMCVRSQIHQIYNNSEEKVELYKMIRSNENRLLKRENTARQEKNADQGAKMIASPFFANRTIVCFTMALNEPQVQRKPLFQAPTYRPVTTSVGKRVVHISKPIIPRAMCFQVSGDGDNQYMKKLKNFLDFLFKINFSNNIYVPFDFAKPDQTTMIPRYRAYIGKGNNSLLVKSLLKRRFWWEIVESPDTEDLAFYWSQNIVEEVHERQKQAQRRTQPSQLLTKRKQTEDTLQLNRKILPLQKCSIVERYINKDGYMVPFEPYSQDFMSNHLPRNYCIGSKKHLFKSLHHFFTQKHKNPFDYIPKTYHIRSVDDIGYKNFVKENQQQPDRVWIVKPGENTNRGNGITLSTFSSIQSKLRRVKHQNGQPLTYIVQSYLNRPFLYNGRKFDIRHYLLVTSVNGLLKAYWYRQGYLRTSSEPFDLEDLDNLFIHLTNDAVQRRSQDYQKYQPANKLSYSQFQRYLDYTYPAKGYNFDRDILPKMKELAAYVVRANCAVIDHRRHQNNFQIFGLDFMIDRDFKPWLIEVNYNPCLQVNCPVLERIIPSMVQNSFRVGLDPLFPPTAHFPPSKRFYLTDHYLKNLRYELIFDEQSHSPLHDYGFIDQKQREQQYQDEGQQVNELMV